jgi:hypothetical protein
VYKSNSSLKILLANANDGGVAVNNQQNRDRL